MIKRNDIPLLSFLFSLTSGLPRGHIQVWPAKNSKALLLFKIVKQFSVNASPDILVNYQCFLSAWTQLLSLPSSLVGGGGEEEEEEEELAGVVGGTVRGLVEVACMLDKETFVLTTQEHIRCASTCNVQCVIEQLLQELEATPVFRHVFRHVTALPEADLVKLENIFGTWPSVGGGGGSSSEVRDNNVLSALKGKVGGGGRSGCCDMNQVLCLCHFVTAFLLSWPYALPPCPPPQGSLGHSLQVLSGEVQRGAHGQVLMEELSTLHRQLSKLSGYHSPNSSQSPTSSQSPESCLPPPAAAASEAKSCAHRGSSRDSSKAKSCARSRKDSPSGKSRCCSSKQK